MTKINCRTALCTAALCALLAGCAGKPALEHHEYLLRPQQLETASGSHPAVRLKAVSVAPYLDQDGIVLQTASAEIRVANQHAWAEPLEDAIRRYLQVSIANHAGVEVEVAPLTTGAAETSLTVAISQFHGSADGRVRLVAGWTVARADREPLLLSFDQSVRQAADGYPALVVAHAELLERLAEAISDSLK